MEIADIILINKSEGENRQKAELAKKQIEFALHLTAKKHSLWDCKVLLVSALTGEGIGEFAMEVDNFIAIMRKSSDF